MTTEHDGTRTVRPPLSVILLERLRVQSGVPRLNRSRLATTAAVVVIFGAAVGAAAAVSVAHSGVTYQSSAQLLIDDPRAVAVSTDAGIIAKLSALRLKYVALVPTTSFAQVIDSTADVDRYSLGDVSATAPANSLTLTVTATSSHRADATDLASATANAITQYAATDQSRAGVPRAQRYSFTIVNPARRAVQISPRRARVIVIGVIAGLIGAVLAAVVLWRRVRSVLA